MKTERLLTAALCMLLIFPMYGQSVKNGAEYRRFYLAVHAGPDFALGASNTILSEKLLLPATKRGFSPGFDGAWFFTKNYGVGVKYAFYKSNYEEESYREFTEQAYDSPVYEYKSLSFKEEIHIVGPAFYARWPLGNSKWMIVTNAGVVLLHDKLSRIEKETRYIVSGYVSPEQFPGEKIGAADHKGITAGFALSAAIRYQLAPFAGISIQTNGLYGSVSKMEYYNQWEERYENGDISRKIRRIGLSAAIDFCF
ncbi:hypothetical protein [Limibacterium fermenti]|uniref:hypothetical protein n=1 Tax=Limibacterium fermenti TaxID=3229863 RepID=UPI000E7E755B|nr:hypothetical protein [Porphyromonadaceae bacterium]